LPQTPTFKVGSRKAANPNAKYAKSQFFPGDIRLPFPIVARKASFVVVEPKVSIQAGSDLGNVAVVSQINVLEADRSPQSFHEDVVMGASAPVHAYRHFRINQRSGERFARELAALIRIEDLGRSLRQRPFKSADAKPGIEAHRQLPGDDADTIITLFESSRS
jgi:hypothetical protein